MSLSGFDILDLELAAWHEASLSPTLWWRDDDAISCSLALERFTGIVEANHIPVMLAIVPSIAEAELAAFTARHPLLQAATHGYAHHNHAGADQKKTELTENPQGRSIGDVRDELREARRMMEHLFGIAASEVLVPPWNRLSTGVARELAATGFRVVSTFGERKTETTAHQVNCHVDMMEWKPVRKGKPLDQVIMELTDCLKARRVSLKPTMPIGILSHHLVHDDAAWETSEKLMAFIASQPIITVASRDDLLEQAIG